MKLKGHSFEFNAGQEVVNGKPCWPDCINIAIPKHQALDMAAQIISQVQRGNTIILLGGCGKLEYDEPQG